MSPYDPMTAHRSVNEVVAACAIRLLHTGLFESMYDADSGYRERLRELGCQDEYIESAMVYARQATQSALARLQTD